MSTMSSFSSKASLLWMLGALLLDATKAEFFLGSLTDRSSHLVAGEVYLLSDRAIEVRNFVYDGLGPNAIWWIDTQAVPTSGTGYVAADGLPSNNCHTSAENSARIPAADGTGAPQRVELPDGKTINDFLGGSLSVWCDRFSANFGEVAIPASVEIPTDTVELQCFDNAAPTSDGVFLSTFTTITHDVAGELWLLSDRVLEIRNYSYDGLGPAGFFWIDTQSPPTSGGRVASDAAPSGNCAMDPDDTPLPPADGITQRVELPEGTTINDYLDGSLSVWCESFGANFGHATIPATVEVPAVGPDLECSRSPPENEPVFLSSFTTRGHAVEGDLYLVSDRVLQIRNYIYDGTGPAAFFWMDTEVLPTRGGIVVSDGYPSNGCAMSASEAPLPAANGITQYVELPPGTTVRDFAGGSLSVWCERFAANFGEAVIPSLADLPASPNDEDVLDCFDEDEMQPAPIATTPEGFNCEELSDFFQVRWQIAGDNLNVELLGRISEDQYMGFGVSGDPQQRTWMIGADAVVADITESGPRARDIYMDSRSQCANSIGVCPDTDGGFANDVSDVSSEQDFGLTLIRYKRPLVPTDQSASTSNGESVDKSIPTQAGIETFVVWGIGPVSPGGFPLFHEFFPRGIDVSLDFARPIADNCEPLAFTGGTDAPTMSPPPPFRRPLVGDSDGSTVFEAHIGPSGGPRGYTAITGQPSWGIAWYINGYLIPKLTLRRGTTYTFRASGGDDVNNDAKYHPFYLTDNPNGGYRQQTPADRLAENVIAGIDIKLANATGVFEYEPTLVAPICEYTVTNPASEEAQLSDFEDYFATLDTSCASDESIVGQAAVLEFTPDETTPDTIYYHCVTHKDLGFEIEVIDEDDAKVTLSPTSAPAEEMDLDEFTTVALQSRLEGATLNYRVNLADPAAGGVDTVTMVLEAPANAWVGLAFNNNQGGMVGSEAVIGLPDTGDVQKYNLNGRSQDMVVPMPQSQQTLMDATITQGGGFTTLTFTKILVEPNEIPISVAADNTFLVAWGFSNTLSTHAVREAFTVNLESGDSATDSDDKTKRMLMAHGFLAAFAWGALTPMAISSSMIRKCMPEGLWFQIHRAFNGFSVILTIVAFALAVSAIGQSGGDNPGHFDKSIAGGHRLIGLIIFIVAILQATGGFFRPHLPPKDKDEESQEAPKKSTARFAWEIGHRVFGFCILGLCWFQVHLGIMQYHTLWGTTDDQPSSLTAFWVIAISIMGFGIIGWCATFNK